MNLILFAQFKPKEIKVWRGNNKEEGRDLPHFTFFCIDLALQRSNWDKKRKKGVRGLCQGLESGTRKEAREVDKDGGEGNWEGQWEGGVTWGFFTAVFHLLASLCICLFFSDSPQDCWVSRSLCQTVSLVLYLNVYSFHYQRHMYDGSPCMCVYVRQGQQRLFECIAVSSVKIGHYEGMTLKQCC